MEFTEQEQYLVYLTEKGAIERYGEITAEIRERLEYELNVIISKGFTEYFLVLEDIVKYCKANDIALGPGRGSAGGSGLLLIYHKDRSTTIRSVIRPFLKFRT